YATDRAEDQRREDPEHLSGTERRAGRNPRSGERLFRRVRQRRDSLDCRLHDRRGGLALDGGGRLLGVEFREGGENDRVVEETVPGGGDCFDRYGRTAVRLGRRRGGQLFRRRNGPGSP